MYIESKVDRSNQQLIDRVENSLIKKSINIGLNIDKSNWKSKDKIKKRKSRNKYQYIESQTDISNRWIKSINDIYRIKYRFIESKIESKIDTFYTQSI